MYKFLVKNGQLVAFGIGLLITVIFFAGAAGGDSPERFNFGLSAAILLAILCALGMLLFGLYHMATNLKGSVKGLITFGAIIVLFGILYGTANAGGNASLMDTMKEFNVGENVSKFISAAIWTTLALGVIAIASFALSEIRNFFK